MKRYDKRKERLAYVKRDARQNTISIWCDDSTRIYTVRFRRNGYKADPVVYQSSDYHKAFEYATKLS